MLKITSVIINQILDTSVVINQIFDTYRRTMVNDKNTNQVFVVYHQVFVVIIRFSSLYRTTVRARVLTDHIKVALPRWNRSERWNGRTVRNGGTVRSKYVLRF